MRNRVPFRRAVAAAAGLTVAILVFPVRPARAADGNPLEQILAALGVVQNSLATLASQSATTLQRTFTWTVYQHSPLHGRTIVYETSRQIDPGQAIYTNAGLPGPTIRWIEAVFHASHPNVVPTITVGTSSAFGGSNINTLYPGDMARLR